VSDAEDPESDAGAADGDGFEDPTAFAARAPEPTDVGGRAVDAATDGPDDPPVLAVGVGPGNPAYLVPRARRAVREADVLVGFETVVDVVRDHTTGEVLECGYRDQAETLAAFADRVRDGARGTAVLMGDPNHSGYQLVGRVERAVDRPVRVVPGISALQLAASRARTPMEESTFVTLHRRGDLTEARERLRRDVGDRHLLVLPRPFDLMPGDIAADLLDSGADPALPALVLERLTHDDEAITRSTLGGLAEHASEESESDEGGGREDTPFSDLSVLVVRRG
jgi:cobalt-precorrin-7 (C5)-methyltransferase